MTSSPTNFSTVPPCASIAARGALEEAEHQVRSASGSSRPASSVYATRSQKRTVTVLRPSTVRLESASMSRKYTPGPRISRWLRRSPKAWQSRCATSSSGIRSRPSTRSTACPSPRRRRGVRPARPERGRQDDDHRDADDPRPARLPGRPHRRRRRDAAIRCGRAAQLAVVPQQSNLDRSISIRDNLIFHAAYHGVPARRARGAGRRAARPVRAARPRRGQARLLLRRTVAAGDDRPRAHARAAGALPRRADDRASTRRRASSSGTACASSATRT